MQKKNRWLLAAIIWFITTVILLTLPGSAFPKEDWLDKIWFDKWVHIGLFGLLVLLFALYIRYQFPVAERMHWFVRIAILATLYGIAMEFVQKYFIPHRSFDVGDIIADAAGSAGGLLWAKWFFLKK